LILSGVSLFATALNETVISYWLPG